jgi:acyl-CoA thioesterase-1
MKNIFFVVLFLVFIAFLMSSCKNDSSKMAQNTKEETTASKESAKPQNISAKQTILFFGNSLTAGYKLEKEESFPSLIQDRIDSLGLEYMVVNGGLSGETTSGGKERISWVLRTPVDVFVLELGANDMLRGLNLEETRNNLDAIIQAVLDKNPETKIIIAGMDAPPNMGPEYVKDFKSIFSDLAEKYNAGLVPFLLEGVAGRPELNLEDQKHPNAEGQKIVVENVWAVLKGYL